MKKFVINAMIFMMCAGGVVSLLAILTLTLAIPTALLGGSFAIAYIPYAFTVLCLSVAVSVTAFVFGMIATTII